MAKRRQAAKDEILLVPFLDILCSLIGVLILIIVTLCVSQSQQTSGRTQEEVQMAQEAKNMKKQIEERTQLDKQLQARLIELEELQKNIDDKEERYLKFRRLMDTSKDLKEQNKQIAMKLQKELDDLLTEIDGLKAEQKESQKTITDLMAEIKKRQVDDTKKIPPVVVQPSGSGLPAATKVYFVECTTGLKILGAWGPEDYTLSAKAEVVVADAAYNHFLREVQKDPNALVLFLIRDDGQTSFNNGAGRAESDYKVKIGKLPIPGRGQLDLAMFDKFRGKIPPPPPPASEAPGAPAPSKPAAPGADKTKDKAKAKA